MACLSPQKNAIWRLRFFVFVFFALWFHPANVNKVLLRGILTSRNGLSRTELFFLAFLRRYFRSFLRPARSHAVEKENFFLPHVSICYRMGFSRSSSVKTFLESEEKEVFRISLLCRTTSFSPVFFFEITSLYQRIIRIAIFLFFK